MNGSLDLSIYEIVGSPLCVASEDGQKVFDRIAAALRPGRTVTVSFRNVTSLTSAFLNTAIGQLYGSFNEDEVRAKLRVQDTEPDDRALVKRVVDAVKEYFKEYFKDPGRFEQVLEESFGR